MPNSVTTPLDGGYADHSSNVVGALTSTQMSTKYAGLTQKTPTKNFAFPWKGHTTSYEKGHPFMCPADLAAALVAAGAPVV